MSKPNLPDDLFAAPPPARVPSMCPVGRILADFPAKQRAGMQSWLAMDRKECPDRRIVDELRRGNIPINKDSVSAHRRGVCRCPRP